MSSKQVKHLKSVVQSFLFVCLRDFPVKFHTEAVTKCSLVLCFDSSDISLNDFTPMSCFYLSISNSHK